MHTYATIKELKNKALKEKWKIKQTIGTQVTFILENKFQKQIFYQNMTISSPSDVYILNIC